jgi:RNA polymerase sigma-70 factor (ECF subfamily)
VADVDETICVSKRGVVAKVPALPGSATSGQSGAGHPVRSRRSPFDMNPTYSEDDDRMIRLQDGDAGAFDELVGAWQGPLFGFFLRNTRDPHLSEDLVQDTLLRLYRCCWDYLPRGLFKGFLFRIARNLLIDHSRRTIHDVLLRRTSSRAVSADGEDFDLLQQVPDDLVSPLTRVQERELAEVVREMLTQLPEEQRQTFLLHHYNSLTLSEVADAMDTSLPTAKSRLRLAKEKLRHLLSCRGFADEYIFESSSSDP